MVYDTSAFVTAPGILAENYAHTHEGSTPLCVRFSLTGLCCDDGLFRPVGSLGPVPRDPTSQEARNA